MLWPNFMALLTIRKESALTKAGNYGAYVKRISQVSRKFLLVGMLTPRYLAQKPSTCTVSTEFDGKQSHEIRPGSFWAWNSFGR